MQKPPIKKPSKIAFVKSAIRYPLDLHTEMVDEAKRDGGTLHAVVIRRLRATPIHERLDELAKANQEIAKEQKEIKEMLRELLDRPNKK